MSGRSLDAVGDAAPKGWDRRTVDAADRLPPGTACPPFAVVGHWPYG